MPARKAALVGAGPMANLKYQRITPADFERAIARHPRMTERAVATCRAVLVEGISQKDALARLEAAGTPVTKQLVSYWVRQVYVASRAP